MTQFPNEGIV